MKNLIVIVVAVVLLALTGCSGPVDADIKVKVTLDGRPLADAELIMDGVSLGKTDDKGMFAGPIAKEPGKPVKLVVKKEDGKEVFAQVEHEFTLKPPQKDGAKEAVSLSLEMQRFLIVSVTDKGQPVAGAKVEVADKDAGVTGEDGTLRVTFGRWPARGLKISAAKEGIGQSDRAYSGRSGDKVDMPLYAEAIIKIQVLEDRNGVDRPIEGATIAVAGRTVGKTGSSGEFTYRQKNKLGGNVAVRISAPGHLPAAFTQQVKLGGVVDVRQYFYSSAPTQPNLAVFGFSSNTQGEDISDVIKIVESKFTDELFSEKAFTKVPTVTAKSLANRSKLNFSKLKSKGWRGTPLAEAVDVLVFGSIARGEDDTYVVEASFYESDGRLVMTQAVALSGTGSWRVGRAMSELVENSLASYPFTGVVTEVGESNKVQVNLGRKLFDLGSDDMFILKSVKHDREGRITKQSDGGAYRVSRRGDMQSELVADSADTTKAKLGDQMVRVSTSAVGGQAGAEQVAFKVTGGNGDLLAGANIYIDDRWVGSTSSKGEASVPLRLGSKYKLMVYRHGYQQASQTIKPEKKGESYAFALKSFSCELTVESTPSSAGIFLDDERIGTTPMTKAYAVTLGFHTLRIDAGSGYRAWEEVVEFDRPELSLTGSRAIPLYKDYLAAGEKAEAAGQFDEAIHQYAAAPTDHPDYAELHNRLGQLYLDEKHDTAHAVEEFERVQAIPEVRELVFKQYAVVYTNLGRAYFNMGRSLLKSNRNEALEYFAKAVKTLERARENTRFFPDNRHDEAVHDTYYYRAMSYQSLYQITGRETLRSNVELAWSEYVDFFPPKLLGNSEFAHMHETGLKSIRQFSSAK